MNPHTRYELHVQRIHGSLVFGIIAGAIAAVLGCVYLAATTPGQIIPRPAVHFHMPKPDIRHWISGQIAAHNPLLPEVRQ